MIEKPLKYFQKSSPIFIKTFILKRPSESFLMGICEFGEASLNLVLHFISAVTPGIDYSSFVFTVKCSDNIYPIGLLQGVNGITLVTFLSHT